MLRINDFMASKEDLERKHLNQDVIFKAMTALVKQLKEKLSSLENDQSLIKRTSEELVRQ